MTSHDDGVYLAHILECVALIEGYIGRGKAEFMESALIQDAVLRRLQVMAESTQRLSDDCKACAPEVDWRALSGFRNVLVHDYLGGIDLEQVWTAVESYLPELKAVVQQQLEKKDP
ncbi:MAG: HepT-like ribonuclease domain-containing protein [Cyanobacteria bacterium P01_D01_bin.71]